MTAENEDENEAETFTLFHISDQRLQTLTNDYKQLYPNLSVRQIHDAILETRNESKEGTYTWIKSMAEAQRYADRETGDELSSTTTHQNEAQVETKPKPKLKLKLKLKAEDEDEAQSKAKSKAESKAPAEAKDSDSDSDEPQLFTLAHISDERLQTLTNDYKQLFPSLSVRQIHDAILETRGEGTEGTYARLESMAEAQRYADRGTGDGLGEEGDAGEVEEEEALWRSGKLWREFMHVEKAMEAAKRKRK